MTNKPLLSIENLAISFDDDQTRVVDDVCLKLESNQTVALVGESGSGKSVTAHSIMGLLPYPLASHPCGKILLEDRDLLSLSKQGLQKLRGNKISMIFQEPLTALNPLQKVGKQIAEIITIHQGLSGEKLQQQTLQLLKQVKIINPEQKLEAYPHQLSGGQRQRIMIAMAIANKPDILIADEPTTALDVTVQKDIIELLLELQREMGMAILLITHDLNIVNQVADYVCVMHQGRIIEKQTADGLFSNPQAEYTKMLLNAEPDRSPSPINPQLSGLVLATSKLAVDYALPKPWFFSKPRNFRALHTADIQLNKGQTLGIVGESGSGKSTLAMSLIKLIQSEGDIHLNGQSVNQLDQRAFRPYRNQIQIVFQDPFGSLSPRLPIADIIGEGLRVHRQLNDEQIDKIVIDVLNEVQLDPEIRHRYPHECSGGQRQRIAIARAIVLEPEILILDEPTSALDRAVQIQILSLLKKLQQKYHMSYIFISHDLKVIRSISHHILVMKDGKIIERGASNDIFTRPQKSYTQELLQAASQ